MPQRLQWEDPANALVGAAILVSPWPMGYALDQAALANAVIVGTLLVTVSIGAAVVGRTWVEWAPVGLGAWLLAAPWVLRFAHPAATWSAVGGGALALLLGGVALAIRWWQGRAGTPCQPAAPRTDV